ncbi:AAA family ATPase [Arthrobacter sp. BF1]|uniref:AAA family ATPase n=1 Tax=Arthrobacter sp. BF1 TaxID=2821145 RepID=UPI001C4FAC96|nr:AAA family ATPase [Arthrobacter sp. BF1]
MRTLDIATAPRQDSRHWVQDTITWEELIAWTESPADVKECGNYVLGRIEPSTLDHRNKLSCTDLHRRKETVVSRSAITLDADHANASLPDQVELVHGFCALIHTTYSSTPEGLRYRLVFPTDRDMTPDEYRRVTVVLMEKLGKEQFDGTCAQPERFMYRPSGQHQGSFQSRVVDGDLISVDALLAEYVEPATTSAPVAGSVSPALSPAPDERYVRASIEGARNDLAELSDLPEGARTDRGHGWDDGTYAAACQLVRAVNSGTGYTLEDAEKDFMEHAPAAEGTYDPAYKWASAQKDVGEASLVPLGAAGEDFGVVAPEGSVREREAASNDAPGCGGSTWEGIDLAGFLDGTKKAPAPTLMTRGDGVSLLYPGLTHSIHGESESGKSLVMQHVSAGLIMNSQHVLYLDFESDPGSIVERLLMLGATRDAIAEYFVYLQPETDPDRSVRDLAALSDTLGAHHYALAVIDGVSEAMAVVLGASKDYNEAAIEWNLKMPRKIADRTGAAVVQIDHVTKSSESRGRFAIGGQAKMSALTGAAYSIDVVKPLGRGLLGELVLRIGKDRAGHLRGKGGKFSADRQQEMARIIVDSTGEKMVMTVNAPIAEPTERQAKSLLMERVGAFLAGLPVGHEGASISTIKREVTGNDKAIAEAVRVMIEQGNISKKTKGQASLHQLATPYIPDFEALETQ